MGKESSEIRQFKGPKSETDAPEAVLADTIKTLPMNQAVVKLREYAENVVADKFPSQMRGTNEVREAIRKIAERISSQVLETWIHENGSANPADNGINERWQQSSTHIVRSIRDAVMASFDTTGKVVPFSKRRD